MVFRQKPALAINVSCRYSGSCFRNVVGEDTNNGIKQRDTNIEERVFGDTNNGGVRGEDTNGGVSTSRVYKSHAGMKSMSPEKSK